ncbi:sensor histidine kinase [Diplocloster modestus]|uniref:histidine kinase n=1 Tax=Diplocloster modestus TaxID=2850322 RepID=A0ABS6KDZ6_9FIRM|nr:HAMP domain-containing sensor histidine kinase [Diplocloster modestus]MBU9728737.1 HAMP domain-containing histidine kinase [Diplocloster modestus]
MNKWPLQIKITLLVGIVATLACLILTAHSIYSAQSYYSILGEETVQKDSLTEKRISKPEIAPGEIILNDPVSPYQEATKQFSIQSLLVMLGVIIFSVILTYYLAGRLLQPLSTLTRSIRAIDQGQLHQRVDLPEAAGEVLQLTSSFNSMMDRLEESFKVQKNFSANAAHELKTPLAVLKASLQVLEMDDEPSIQDYQEFTKAAKVCMERLVGTVDALMSLTKNTGEDAESYVEMLPLLKLIVTELKGKADLAEVSLNISGTCKAVHADQTLLYQLLFNLAENAVKYNRPGGSVDFTLSEINNCSVIQVTDTGIGISKEDLPHVFEPFYRADRSRSQKIPGSGLGLSVVKTIAESCGGDIRLESTAGVGTTITIVF